jgi:hypothetical protein
MIKRWAGATLVAHIQVVLSLCPNGQMIRIDTGRIITRMHEDISIWDFFLRDLIRDCMRVTIFSIVVKPAVSLSVLRGVPYNTTIGAQCGLCPKSGKTLMLGGAHGLRRSFSSFVMRWLSVRFSLNP